MKDKLVIVRGGGDIATGTIQALHRAGFSLLVLEVADPSAIRRQVALSEAVYDETASVEDVAARLCRSGKAIENFPTVADPPYNNPYNIAQKNKLGKKVEEEKDEDGESREKDVNSAPSAVGKTFEEAIQILNGYKAGYIEEYSDTVPEGTVISQSVQEGKVVIVVSKGPKP